jgi:hypothetical protein
MTINSKGVKRGARQKQEDHTKSQHCCLWSYCVRHGPIFTTLLFMVILLSSCPFLQPCCLWSYCFLHAPPFSQQNNVVKMGPRRKQYDQKQQCCEKGGHDENNMTINNNVVKKGT